MSAVIVLGLLLALMAGCGSDGGATSGATTVISENPTTPPVSTIQNGTTSTTPTSGGSDTTGGSTTTGGSGTPAGVPKLKPGQAAVGVVDNPRLGPIVVNSDGHTLYVYDFDTGKLSQCYGTCTATWHPLTTNGPVLAATGVDASLLGTIRRDDGIIQVTCAGHPVYTYAGDRVAGNDKSVTTKGNNYHYTMPDQWHVLGPNCEPKK